MLLHGLPQDLAIRIFLQVNSRGGSIMKPGHRDIAKDVRAYRRRIAAAGEKEVMFKVSNETVALIDELKQRLGLRNRGQVLEQHFRNRREAAQQ